MHVYGIQIDSVWEDKTANFDKVTGFLDDANVEPGSLIVLSEMFSTGFSLNVKDICESESKETERFLRETAKRCQSTVIGGLVTLASDNRGRNVASVIDPAGNKIARYCKLHPFSFARETEYYDPGDKLALFPWGEFTVAPFLCYDLRFPEIFRHTVQLGADMYVVMACWPEVREEHWMALLRARAIENQAYIIGVNRCGNDPEHSYSGRSQIIDPLGVVIADAQSEETVIHAELDYPALVKYRQQFPALSDIRTEYKFD